MATKNNSSSIEPQPRIFLSYARKDGEEFARELCQSLEAHGLSVWQDQKEIEGTKKWWAQIELAIQSVEYMVLVVTKASLKSKIVQREWKFARQEGRGVIPIIGSKELDFSKMPRWMKAEHFVDIDNSEQWTRFLRTLEGPHQSIRVRYIEDKLPDNFVERPREFESLLRAMLDSGNRDAIAITATLQGAGGFGKTILARALCHNPEVKEAYLDGIHWVTIGETPGDLTGRILDLIERISGQRPGYETLEMASDRLAELLAEHIMLLVIDDVWDPIHLKPFLKGGLNCTRLITTRNKHVVPSNTISVFVDRMGKEEAVALLKEALPDGTEEKLEGLAMRLGHWPLLLNLVASAMREERGTGESATGTLSYIEEGLSEEGLTAFDVNNVEDRNMAVAATINVSVRRLEESSRDRFEELSIFPEDTKIPFQALEVYWGKTGCLTPFKVKKVVRELSRYSLLWEANVDGKYLQLHDVFRGYLRVKKKKELVELQNTFLEAWKSDQPWSALDRKAPYIWQHLAWHLVGANRQEELQSLCLDFAWLEAKLGMTDPAAVLNDFDFVKDNDALAKVAGTIRLSAHVLGNDQTQLSGQLVGRLQNVQRSEIQNLLIQAQKESIHPWLRPLNGNLIQPGGPLIRTLSGHSYGVTAVTVTPDGRRAISGADDETCKVWDLETGQKIFTLSGHSGQVTAVTVTPDGRRAISGADDETCKVWDLETGQEIFTLSGHSGRVTAVTVTPDGRRAISGADDKTCKVWDLEIGQEIFALSGHSRAVEAVTVTPDGMWAITASTDQTCKVWDLAMGHEVFTLRGHSGLVEAVTVTPDGTRAISASNDQTCKVWDLETGQEVFTLSGHSGGVTAVTVTPDGTRAITASTDQTCKVWDLATRHEVFALRGHSGSVEAVTVTPDGTRAITASTDQTCKVWDLAMGHEVFTLRGHSGSVEAVTVTPDGTRAISASNDQTCKVWDLVTRS